MVMDVLARDRRLCVVKLQPGYEASYAGKPAVHAVGGLARSSRGAARQRPLNILVRGDARVRIEHELPADTLYRLVA